MDPAWHAPAGRQSPSNVSGHAAQQTLVRYIQTDHGDIRAGMEHTVRCFGILDDVRFGGQIPTVAFLGECAAHHHQSQSAGDVRCCGKSHIDIG